MLSSIILFKQVKTSLQLNKCTKAIEVDGQQYQYCSKQLGLNQHIINTQLSILQNSANIFINTKYTKQTIVILDIFSVNVFAVFGFADNNHIIENGLINVSLNVNVSQAALICMQCQLVIRSSQLIFIANGQILSAVSINVLFLMKLVNSSVQFRFQSLQGSGLVSQITESVTISLVDVKINGYNSVQSTNNGNFASKLLVDLEVNLANVQLCTNEDKTVGFGISYLKINGIQFSNCQNSCQSGSYYSYGVCVQQLVHGEMAANDTLICVDPFEFKSYIAQCSCKDGYMLNMTYCIPVVVSITNLDETMHDLNEKASQNIQQQKIYLEQMIITNTTTIQQYLNGNISNLNSSISQKLVDVEANMQNNVSQLQQQIKANISEIQIMMANNRSILESYTVNNISQLQEKIYHNLTGLNNTIQIEIQQVNQSANQIASDLQALQTNFQQVVTDQSVNNSNQQTQIGALNSGVLQLQNSQQQLRSDLVYLNTSFNSQIQNLNTQVGQIDTNVASLTSKTTNQYNQQQAQLANLDQYLANNISNLNTNIQGQIQILRQADSTISSSLTQLLSQFSSFSSDSTQNNTNQQNQINSLQSTASAQQTQQSLLQSNIQQLNTTLTGQVNNLYTQISSINSSITNLDSQLSTQFSSQQSQLTQLTSNLQTTNNNLNNLNTSISQLTFTTQINQEAVLRAQSDSQIQGQINSAISENSNTNILIQAVQTAIQKQINDFNIYAAANYATKAQLV
ncbi:Conserved_hypothetical protein [Hexamita inflata]|uniref:Uncharacterized protein n=1 Tax=Hexamita inflata TaxID=28002 RepID=A0AA86NSS3_9EUKA|nr:Conserved hypothetical protein [Hexamita inflata]